MYPCMNANVQWLCSFTCSCLKAIAFSSYVLSWDGYLQWIHQYNSVWCHMEIENKLCLKLASLFFASRRKRMSCWPDLKCYLKFLYMAKPGATRVWLKAIRLLYKVRTSRMGTLALRGVMMEIIKHIIASGKVSWDIFWKYKNKEILHSDWKAWFDHRKFCVLVELNVLWDCFFLLFKLYFWTVFKTRLYEVAG